VGGPGHDDTRGLSAPAHSLPAQCGPKRSWWLLDIGRAPLGPWLRRSRSTTILTVVPYSTGGTADAIRDIPGWTRPCGDRRMGELARRHMSDSPSSSELLINAPNLPLARKDGIVRPVLVDSGAETARAEFERHRWSACPLAKSRSSHRSRQGTRMQLAHPPTGGAAPWSPPAVCSYTGGIQTYLVFLERSPPPILHANFRPQRAKHRVSFSSVTLLPQSRDFFCRREHESHAD
jgi:hypothetical protein